MKNKSWSVLYSMPLILVVYIPLLLLLLEYHRFPLIEFSEIKYFFGIVLLLSGGLLMLWAYRSLMKDGEGQSGLCVQTEALVKNGPYRFLRNPMSLGIVVILLGESLYFSSIALFLYMLLVWAGMAYYIKNVEEYALANKYGQSYIDYKMDVNPWFPKLSAFRNLKAK